MNAANLASLSPTARTRVVRLFDGLKTTRTIENYIRVLRRASLDPLAASRGPSRFSSLPTGFGSTYGFGIIYLAADLATALYEVVIRDRFDMNPFRVLMPSSYRACIAANVSSVRTLTLLDLTDGNAVRYGVPTDVIRYSVHTDGQHFSEFAYRNMPEVDGILYRSRLTERLCIAIYDRAHDKLVVDRGPQLLIRDTLADALRSWNVTVR